MKWTAKEAAKAAGGRVVRGPSGATAGGVSTDSRTLKAGEGFIPLTGKNFDGHVFLPLAAKKGAAWVMQAAGRRVPALPTGIAVIEVEDTLEALGRLAAAWRAGFRVKVAAVTGSVGKSTTKEMIAEVLAAKGRTLKNEGNFNNRIGLPQTLFRLHRSHCFAVLEMGMNEPGEIGKLTEMARPDAGLITRVAPVHLEGLGSLAKVAQAKAELIQGLGPRTIFILNLDDPWIGRYTKNFPGRVIGFSSRPETAFPGESLRLMGAAKEVIAGRPRVKFWVQEKQGGRAKGRPVEFYLPTLSPHDAVNALAAAAMGRAFGVSLAQAAAALHHFQGLKGRGEAIRSRRGTFIIDESYNSNPVAVENALLTMNWWRGPRRGVAVLGEMLELGRDAEKYHRAAGATAAAMGVSLLVARGPHGKAMVEAARSAGLPGHAAVAAPDNAAAVRFLKNHLKKGDWVLVKGSRGIGLESVVKALR